MESNMFSKFPMNVRNDRQLKALTGTSLEQFDVLEIEFAKVSTDIKQEKYEKDCYDGIRERKIGGGRKSKLSNFTMQLFFILFYFKCYPTFDVLGSTFDLSRSKAHENVYKLVPILQKTLENLNYMPHRKFESLEEFKEAFKNFEIILADATERPVQRPVDEEKQAQVYSGKRKLHTIKNTILCTKDKIIHFIGETFFGSMHDFNIFKQEFTPELNWFENIQLFVDLGYYGINNIYVGENINIPHKNPPKTKSNPNPELTCEQKRYNSMLGKMRVIVENAIAGLKRYNILKNTFRNKINGFNDKVIAISAGLWNMMMGGIVR